MGFEITKRRAPLKAALIEKTAAHRERHGAEVRQAAVSMRPARNDLLPAQQITLRNLDDLKPARKRVRKANAAQIERVMASIKQSGFAGAILIRGDRVVDGHARIAAMHRLGETQVPCIDVSHLSDDDCRMLTISMNRIAETGEWDLPVLRDEICELDTLTYDLGDTGFSPQELDIILLDPADDGDDADDLLPAESDCPVVTSVGDLWLLGGHRLLCGDALNAESYAQLLDGNPASVVFTDPPFNVKIKGNVSGLGKVKHDEFAMASGEMDDAEFGTFLETFLAHSRDHCVPDAVVFAFMDWRHFSDLDRAGRHVGLKLINMAVWNKGAGGMGSFYRSAHELVAVFCNGTVPAINNVALGVNGRDRTNVWNYAGANRRGSSASKALAGHPTPKSVELVVDALLDASMKGDIVLDPFMGSGTTIMAAERCRRIACGIELEPRYVELAIRRWQEGSGKAAILAATGETFEQTRARREAV